MKRMNDFFSLFKRVKGSNKSTTVHVSSQIRIEPAKECTESKVQGGVGNENETVAKNETANPGKAQIHNLIIVDESGSMSHLREATMSGVNETINTIRSAQTEFAATQEHLLTLVTFDSSSHRPDVRTIIDTMPIQDVAEFSDYRPNGCWSKRFSNRTYCTKRKSCPQPPLREIGHPPFTRRAYKRIREIPVACRLQERC